MIDCPPTPSVLTLSAFAASDFVIIPVTPDYFATIGLPQFLGTLKDFKDDLQDNHDIQPLGIVFTNVPRTKSTIKDKAISRVKSAVQEFSPGTHIFHSKMTHLKVYQKALWQSCPVQKITGRGQRGKSLAVEEIFRISNEAQLQMEYLESL